MSNSAPTEPLDLQTTVQRIRLNRGPLIGIVVAAIAVALLYVLLVPPLYEAHTTIFFPPRPSSILGPNSVAESGSSGAGQLLGGSGPSSLKIFRAFLESDRSVDYVADSTQLKRKKIREITKFNEDPQASTLSVSVQYGDKEVATALVKAYLVAMGDINGQLSLHSLEADTNALGKELATQEASLKKSEDALLDFTKRAASSPSNGNGQNGNASARGDWSRQLIVARIELNSVKANLDYALRTYKLAASENGRLPADIPPVNSIRPELVKAEYKLNLLRQSQGPDAPEVKRQVELVDNLRTQLRSEVRAFLESAQRGLADPTKKVSGSDLPSMISQKVSLEARIAGLEKIAKSAPEEESSVARLSRQVSTKSEIVKQISVQYHLAKLQSLRDPNKWMLLDEPRLQEEPLNKKFGTMGLFGLLAGLFIGIVWCLNFGRKS